MKPMIQRLNKKATIRLLVAIKSQAETDINLYKTRRPKRGSDYISNRCYASAQNYLEIELPVIREILAESFKEKTQWQ